MSVVSYNSVVLPYARTVRFSQEAQYDDQGQTDWYLTKYDMEFEAVINADYLAVIAPDLAGLTTNPAQIMAVIRNRLLQPRRRMSVLINGVELMPQNNLPGTVDAANGPKPQSCIITQLSDVTFLLSYHIVASYWETTSATGDAPPSDSGLTGNTVLFNRWSETVDIDNLNYSTRTRTGKFVIRSDNQQGKIADMVRTQMAVVGVPPDFLRQSSRYTVDPSGLGVAYTIIDREQFKMPPDPAYEAEGTYTESVVAPPGVFVYADVRLKLKAPKNVPQTTLLQTAVFVATEKLKINGAPVGGSGSAGNVTEKRAMLSGGSIEVDMYKNEVVVHLHALKSLYTLQQNLPSPVGDGKDRVYGLLAFNAANMCVTPGSAQGERAQPLSYPAYGSAGLLMQAAAYYDPALQNTNVNQATGQLSAGAEPGTAGLTPEV